MKTISALIAAVMIPLLVLNILGGFVSGVWLLILRQWGAVGWGLVYLVVGGFGLSLAMMPGLIFALPLAYFVKRNNRFATVVVGMLSLGYTSAVIGAWCTFTLVFFVRRATGMGTLIPLLIWAYGAALGPLQWLSQKEEQSSGNDGSYLTTLAAQLGFIVAAVLVATAGMSIIGVFLTIAATTFVIGIAPVLLTPADVYAQAAIELR